MGTVSHLRSGLRECIRILEMRIYRLGRRRRGDAVMARCTAVERAKSLSVMRVLHGIALGHMENVCELDGGCADIARSRSCESVFGSSVIARR